MKIHSCHLNADVGRCVHTCAGDEDENGTCIPLRFFLSDNVALLVRRRQREIWKVGINPCCVVQV